VEGQRIISGMQDSLHLFLARAMYMSLVILGAAFLNLAMPVSPRHNTVLGLLTVGVPALFLAIWARPARPGLDSLRRILRLIIPPAIVCAGLGVPLYAFYSSTGSLDVARTAFTTFATFCGLGMLPLLEPPIGESMSGADADGADIRPTLLALALLAVYGAFFAIAPLREFFELAPLSLVDVAAIAAVAVVWAVITMAIWRFRLLDQARSTYTRVRGPRPTSSNTSA
jgi:cation-transporting ATPase E